MSKKSKKTWPGGSFCGPGPQPLFPGSFAGPGPKPNLGGGRLGPNPKPPRVIRQPGGRRR